VSRVINVMLLEPGGMIALANGATAEVVSNPRDGVWIFGRYVSSPADVSLVGAEEMIFAQDIVGLLEV